MKERPILFSGPMVNAILEGGRKTQTRRIVKFNENVEGHDGFDTADEERRVIVRKPWSPELIHRYKPCPYGQIGDRLWVRETWADVNTESGPAILYKAFGSENTPRYHFCSEDAFPVEYDRYPTCKFTMWCGDLLRGEPGHSWRPSIFMPRWASRITLEITNVRVERLQDITEADAKAEGVIYSEESRDYDDYSYNNKNWDAYGLPTAKQSFQTLWDKINSKRASWESNPWVWVIEFRRI